MAFRFDRFYKLNSRILIWAGIVGLIYIMRDFFALIFMTFLLCSFTLPVIGYLQRNTRLPRTMIIVGVYLLILVGLVVLVSWTVPSLYVEAREANSHLAAMTGTIRNTADEITSNATFLKPFIDPYVGNTDVNLGDAATSPTADLGRLAGKVQPYLIQSARITVKAVSTTLLSLLFSFLIVLDLSRLTFELRLFKESRLRQIIAESAQPVLDFASVLGRSLRAQAVIAVCNTILTLIGLAILKIPMLTLLSITVFFFSFIPVLGVFISTAPAVLLALKVGGLSKGVAVVIMVTLIHLVEAYILNPLIYGQQLKINPVMVLVILFVGHHFFGVWGMLLGLPVAYYFLVYVFGVPIGNSPVQPSEEPVPQSADESTPP